VRRYYDERVEVHKKHHAVHEVKKTSQFASLLLGISDAAANYSAKEHALGPRVVSTNANA
jgi:hypothetical protein